MAHSGAKIVQRINREQKLLLIAFREERLRNTQREKTTGT